MTLYFQIAEKAEDLVSKATLITAKNKFLRATNKLKTMSAIGVTTPRDSEGNTLDPSSPETQGRHAKKGQKGVKNFSTLVAWILGRGAPLRGKPPLLGAHQIGRASCRERVFVCV